MFRLLLKHDWRSIRGILGLLCLISLGAGAAGGVAMRFLILSTEAVEFSAFTTVLSMLSVMVCYIAIVLCAAGTLFFCIWRFYKSRFADESYMTFTVPATAHQILLSSLTVTLLTMICATAAVLISIGIAGSIGVTAIEGFYVYAFQELPSLLGEIRAVIGEEMGAFLSMLVYAPIAAVSGVVFMMLSVTVGSVIARRLKFLAAIGVYYGINVVISLVTTVIMILAGLASTDGRELVSRFFLYPAVLMAALAVGAYFLMHRLASRKLDLP